MAVVQDDHLSKYYRVAVLVAAIASFGALIPLGIASYKFDQCSENLQVTLDTLQTKIDAAKSAIGKK